MMKQITKGHEARLKVKAGIDQACDAVRPTLGAIGMTALVEYPGLDPIECDDGVTILRNIELEDHYENMGVQMLRKAALRTSSEGGDGTATTTVLTQALVEAAMKEIAHDSSKIREVKERLQHGLKDILADLKKNRHDVTVDDIEKIATISSLDPEVAKLIAEVINEIGVHGVVTVEKGSQLGYTKEVVKGARFNKGYISHYFINEPETQQCVLNEPYIVLVDRRVSTNEQILSLLNSIGTGKDILFIADDVDSVALATLAQNAVSKIANIACVRNPFTASAGKDFLHDIAALTGAVVISEEKGMKLDDQTSTVCGRAEKIIVTRDTTTIIGGVATHALQERTEAIQKLIDACTSEYTKGMLEERLAQLTGGIGVIRVGAYTDTDFYAKKLKFENAINATQAALQEGVIAGGGSALARVRGKDSMFDAVLTAPLIQMATNAGIKYKDLIERMSSMKAGEGFDFRTGNVVNMFDAGIIDPYKVTRLALESAVAVTSAVIGMEVAIVIVDKKTDESTD